MSFEKWIHSVFFQQPPKGTLELARTAFQAGSDARREKDAQKVENAPPAKSHLMLAAIAKDIREGE